MVFSFSCRSAALCLAQAMLKCPIPNQLPARSGWDHVSVSEGCVSPNLKETLIAWLLMSDQNDEMEDSCRPHPIICRLACCFCSTLFYSDCIQLSPDAVFTDVNRHIAFLKANCILLKCNNNELFSYKCVM